MSWGLTVVWPWFWFEPFENAGENDCDWFPGALGYEEDLWCCCCCAAAAAIAADGWNMLYGFIGGIA